MIAIVFKHVWASQKINTFLKNSVNVVKQIEKLKNALTDQELLAGRDKVVSSPGAKFWAKHFSSYPIYTNVMISSILLLCPRSSAPCLRFVHACAQPEQNHLSSQHNHNSTISKVNQFLNPLPCWRAKRNRG